MQTINKFQPKTVADNFLVMASLSAVFGLAACQQEGPAEKAGQKIDKAVTHAEQKIDRASQTAGDKMDDAKQSVKDKAEIAEEYIDDAMITLKVKAALSNDTILKGSHIDVTTANGVVTLSGTVDSEQSLGRAMEDADSQEHVKSVQSKLAVNAIPRSN